MSVADRLRVEAEQALNLFQDSHRAVENQLAQALSNQQEKDKELESLRTEHRDAYSRLSELTLQQQQERAELDALRSACRVKDITDCDKEAETQKSEEETKRSVEEAETETEAKDEEKQEADEEMDANDSGHGPEETNGSESTYLTGKGVAESYLRSLAALEKKKDEGRGQRDPRRIVMLSERSW